MTTIKYEGLWHTPLPLDVTCPMFIGTGKSGNKDCWFSYSYETAIKDLEEYSKEEVAQIPIPLPKEDRRYYITPTGKAFVARPLCGRIAILTCAPHKGRRNGVPYLQLVVAKNVRKYFSIAQCVYNAFVRKLWDESAIEYKDGNNQNYALSNLKSPETIQLQIEDSNPDKYLSTFRRLVSYLIYRYGTPSADAEDIVQDAYLFVFTNQYKWKRLTEDLYEDHEARIAMWFKVSCHKAIDRMILKIRYPSIDPCDADATPGCEPSDTMNFLSFVKRKFEVRILSLYLKGYENEEIAEVLGYKTETIISAMSLIRRRIKQNVKNYDR